MGACESNFASNKDELNLGATGDAADGSPKAERKSKKAGKKDGKEKKSKKAPKVETSEQEEPKGQPEPQEPAPMLISSRPTSPIKQATREDLTAEQSPETTPEAPPPAATAPEAGPEYQEAVPPKEDARTPAQSEFKLLPSVGTWLISMPLVVQRGSGAEEDSEVISVPLFMARQGSADTLELVDLDDASPKKTSLGDCPPEVCHEDADRFADAADLEMYEVSSLKEDAKIGVAAEGGAAHQSGGLGDRWTRLPSVGTWLQFRSDECVEVA
jgi:hypothetical protein